MTEYTFLRQNSLCSQIVDRIESRIILGELCPGDQLAPERELAQQFGVSRTAVREAVKSLVEKGLLEIRRGRGTFVTDGPSQAAEESLKLMILMGTMNGIPDLMQVRHALEPTIAALAAQNATDDDIRLIEESLATLEAIAGEREQSCASEPPSIATRNRPSPVEPVDHPVILADMAYHIALARATRNPLFSILLNSILDVLLEQRRLTTRTHGGPRRDQIHHKRILAAIIRRDPVAARAAMEAHLAQVQEDLPG